MTDRRHELERQLRAALRDGQPAPRFDAEHLLASVHHGASRRRMRRRVAGVTIVITGVVGAGTVAALWAPPDTTVTVADTPETITPTVAPSASAPARTSTSEPTATSEAAPERSPTPSATKRSRAPSATGRSVEPGVPVEPASFAVESVTAVQRNAFWVLGTGRCPDGTCKMIAHTTDAGATFNFRTGPDPAQSTSPATPSDLLATVEGVDLRYAVTGDDAWGFGEEVWATHDAGRTWAPVTFPVPVAVTSVQASGDTVWAFGTAVADGAPVVMSSPVGADLWVTAELGLADTDQLAAPVVADGVVAAFVTQTDGGQEYVRSLDGGATWAAVPPPDDCDSPVSSSGVEGTVWVQCTSAAGTASLAATADGGDTWAQQPLPAPTSPLTTMTGIDHERALVTDGTTVSIVTVGAEDVEAVQQVPGPYTDADAVWADATGYTYAGFADPATGYLITSGGELARSEDGGQHWTPVELP